MTFVTTDKGGWGWRSYQLLAVQKVDGSIYLIIELVFHHFAICSGRSNIHIVMIKKWVTPDLFLCDRLVRGCCWLAGLGFEGRSNCKCLYFTFVTPNVMDINGVLMNRTRSSFRFLHKYQSTQEQWQWFENTKCYCGSRPKMNEWQSKPSSRRHSGVQVRTVSKEVQPIPWILFELKSKPEI